MITDKKEQQTAEKPPRFYSQLAQAANLVVNHGVDEKTAFILAKGKIPCDTSLKVFKKKVAKYALTAPKMVKKAFKAVEDTLEMKPIKYQASKPVAGIGVVDYEETIMPSITNRLAAAAMVLDRDQPQINRSISLSATASISPVDLLEYMAVSNDNK